MDIGKDALKITATFLKKVFLEDPEITQKKADELEATVTSVVNLRTPGLDTESDTFSESFDNVMSEIHNMSQGKHRYFLISAQELLNAEQPKKIRTLTA